MKFSALILVGVLATVAARPADLDAGKRLYTGKCARCHKLYDPAGYDAQAWDQWMHKMKGKAKLSDNQYRQLTEYLSTLRPQEKP